MSTPQEPLSQRTQILRTAIFWLLGSSLMIAIGIICQNYYQQEEKHRWANTAADLIALQASEKWLADDRLSLQVLVRQAIKLKHVKHAAIFDSGNMLIAESGAASAETEALEGMAKIFTAETEVGIVQITLENPVNNQAWIALAAAPLMAFIAAFFVAINKPKKREEQKVRSPIASDALMVIASKSPPTATSYHAIQKVLPQICELYEAELKQEAGYYLLSFNGGNSVGRALASARLWYGFYYALQRKTNTAVDAAACLCIPPMHLEQDEDLQRQWLFEQIYRARMADGVVLEQQFADQNITSEIAIIAERPQGYFLKQLCKEEDAIVKSQLADLLKMAA